MSLKRASGIMSRRIDDFMECLDSIMLAFHRDCMTVIPSREVDAVWLRQRAGRLCSGQQGRGPVAGPCGEGGDDLLILHPWRELWISRRQSTWRSEFL